MSFFPIFPNLFSEIWFLFKKNSRVDFIKVQISKTNHPNFFASQQLWLMLMLQHNHANTIQVKFQTTSWNLKKALDGIKIGIVFTKIEMLIQHSTEMNRSIRKNLMQTCQKKPNSTLNKWTLHIWLQSSWKVHWTKNKYANKNACVALTACFDSAF